MVDTVAIIDDTLIERISMTNAGKSFLLLEQGAKTEVVGISTHCGGGGLNSAVAFKRLGFDVCPFVKLGRDDRSGIVDRVLTNEKISDRWIVRSGSAPTGASTVISAHDRNAAVFTFRGANSLLEAEELTAEMFDVDVVYVAPLSGDSADILPAIASCAQKRRPLLVVNPGVRQIATRIAGLLALLPAIDILVVNRTEAEALLSAAVAFLSASNDAQNRALAADTLRHATAAKAADQRKAALAFTSAIIGLGARKLLLTDGRAGAYAASLGSIVFQPAEKAMVVGTAGAGDAFASTFAAMTAQGATDADALRAAAFNAASVVSHADAQSGLLTSDELNLRLGGVGAGYHSA
jgi:ribokinase